jgi:putative phosphoribosyl transferase
MPFTNRIDAGRQLAARLLQMDLPREGVVVLGLPRGGVPVAFQVAQAFQAPLDVIVVRKLGVPFQPELAMGAIGEDGVRIINHEVVDLAGIDEGEMAAAETRERAELAGRARRFRGNRPRLDLHGLTAIVVDDGVATGSTARAACRVARAQGAARVILATPVASPRAIRELRHHADEVVCLETPAWFSAIGQMYTDFAQTPDDQVVALLEQSVARQPGVPPLRDDEVELVDGRVRLSGRLIIPDGALGIVVFAHGSASSKDNPHLWYVATVLTQARVGTLIVDLLTRDEQADRGKAFDIPLLGERLINVTGWLQAEPDAHHFRIGYFGAGTGAGAALWAAAEHTLQIAAVVSSGGRPDLAGCRLATVRAPTLLIVGARDHIVGRVNRDAQASLRGENRLTVVPDAGHQFEEPGSLQTVAELARDWFVEHFTPVMQLA